MTNFYHEVQRLSAWLVCWALHGDLQAVATIRSTQRRKYPCTLTT